MNHSAARINYDRMSRFYDLFAGTSERRFTVIGLQMLAVQYGENVLEIGCGTGHSLVALAPAVGASGKVSGLDISEGMLQVTQSRLKRFGLAEQVELRLGDAASLPFSAAGFDVIFMSFSLELFASSEIPIVLKECRRVLRPEGRLGVVALARSDGVAVKVYDWAHVKFPDLIDCHPILVQKAIEEANFQIIEAVKRSMWGLPVEIITARKYG
jgi:ubiquinone/menaquinone biosynthesis C-methylase UbiE